MNTMDEDDNRTGSDAGKVRGLSGAARRALREAEERRRQGAYDAELPAERGGRDGPEPVRYGDWERNGKCVDF